MLWILDTLYPCVIPKLYIVIISKLYYTINIDNDYHYNLCTYMEG